MTLEEWLAGLSDADKRALARDYAEATRAAGVVVVRPDGSEVPIPPIFTPHAFAPEELARTSADARRILSGLVKLTAHLMAGPQAARARAFGSFSPLEAEGLERTWRSAAQLATARVDFLVDERGQPRALEVNATIPAMQGYSDCVAEAFLRRVAARCGMSNDEASALVDANGRNTDDLLASLVAHHERLGGRAEELAIAIVAREGDAQRGELEHYARRWAAAGHRVALVAPGAFTLSADGRARAGDFLPDLVYRHVFARRLEPSSAFARMCLEPERFHVLNPFASHLEVKAMLGYLSAAVDDGAEAERLGLDAGERESIARAVPWTRVLGEGPSRGPGGERVPDLLSWVKSERERVVLKRSWDYGGKSVFLGADFAGDAAQERFRALFGGEGSAEWSELVARAAKDGDAWVVQELVVAPRVEQLLASPDGMERRLFYTDLSAYTNLGVAPTPSGGAVRASASRIVNILGGGGLAPLVRGPVLDRLLASR